jgi:hypothetical protein
MEIKKILQTLVAIIAIAVIFFLVIWWPIYKFNDCRNVGHKILYCIMDLGS